MQNTGCLILFHSVKYFPLTSVDVMFYLCPRFILLTHNRSAFSHRNKIWNANTKRNTWIPLYFNSNWNDIIWFYIPEVSITNFNDVPLIVTQILTTSRPMVFNAFLPEKWEIVLEKLSTHLKPASPNCQNQGASIYAIVSDQSKAKICQLVQVLENIGSTV